MLRHSVAFLPFLAFAQSPLPTFPINIGAASYTFAGAAPAPSTHSIPVTLVPLALTFDSGARLTLDAARDVPALLASPVFTPYPFTPGQPLQYTDALLRASIPAPAAWHNLLAQPDVKPLRLTIPAGFGYVLTAKSSGRSLAVVDAQFLQRELFKKLPPQPGRLVVAFARNTTYYALGDATVCCSWGAHGIDSSTQTSFVLSTVLNQPPSVVEDQDIQPLTQQLAQFFKDPLHDPLADPRSPKAPGNRFPAWMRPAPAPSCSGPAAGSTYFQLEPTNHNPKNNIPASRSYQARAGKTLYHLQNTALPAWYLGPNPALSSTLSFPDPQALSTPAQPCPQRGRGSAQAQSKPAAAPLANPNPSSAHSLIGYWAGYGGPGSTIPLRELSPQWDVVLVAFATPDPNAPEGTMRFRTPAGLDTAQFKADLAHLKSQGRKVLISLGGGGQHFTLADPKRVPNFVDSVARIVTDYGFEGIDIDFESPSLSIAPGDTDFRNPTTPSIVNLIDALRQLKRRLGPKFLITLVPEGTQIPAGLPSYGGQFGSYLPIAHALRDDLLFVDTQSYNTPPLLGLDGEIYQPGTVDYHAAMTELWLQGFHPGLNKNHFFPPFPPHKVATGFLNGDTTPEIVAQTMRWLISGQSPPNARYKLRNPKGYPSFLGAMFWTIDADRRANYNYSNQIGPQLHPK